MATTPDQFETAPINYFSGSYVDDVFVPGTSIFTKRRVYYSAVNPTKLPEFGDVGTDAVIVDRLGGYTGSLAVIRGALTLERQLNRVVAGRSATNIMRKFKSETEIFADSVLMAPPDVVLVNGGQLFEADDYAGDAAGVAGEVLFKTPRKFKIALGTTSSVIGAVPSTLTHSITKEQVSDDIWAYSFPFEHRYSSLERFVKPGFDKKYTTSISQSCDVLAGSAREIKINDYTAPLDHLTGSLYSLQFLHNSPDSPGMWATCIHDQIIGVDDVPHPTTFEPKLITYGRIEEILTGFYGFFVEGGRGANSSVITAPGFVGDTGVKQRNNPGKFASYLSASIIKTPTPFEHRERSIKGVQLRVNGWKQGVYHAIPQKSHCYFRFNHFGHMRDMFEQRPFTKYHDAKTGAALSSPVKAVFVSGSNAYITASSPVTLNPNVSGNYDTEGKMGRPFNDATGSV